MQGLENAPQIAQKCLQSVQRFSSGRKIIILSLENLHEYIDLPPFILEKHAKGIITNTHLSDIIRLHLLSKYGGTWIDSTCYLSDEIPQEITQSEFFVFKHDPWITMRIAPHNIAFLNTLATITGPANVYICSSSWFIHSKANNPIINTTLHTLHEYWKEYDYLVEYFLIHYCLTHVVIAFPETRKQFDKMPSFHNWPPHLLFFLRWDKFDKNVFDNILAASFIHKLTYREQEKNVLEDSFFNHIVNA